jgi:hypothetical protein
MHILVGSNFNEDKNKNQQGANLGVLREEGGAKE